ncbi:hypothetical protein NLJ89_g5113 [Agrocybe chaxingu]|uniref:Uncharacterized protein n=1 Tax=Agrocybe chaxingu TaxID=84603 RepID=A0A9W8MVB5_9AGAR|nr:hypothetical protein NLJ89_g5113 [Agrocybe chaxingu]
MEYDQVQFRGLYGTSGDAVTNAIRLVRVPTLVANEDIFHPITEYVFPPCDNSIIHKKAIPHSEGQRYVVYYRIPQAVKGNGDWVKNGEGDFILLRTSVDGRPINITDWNSHLKALEESVKYGTLAYMQIAK